VIFLRRIITKTVTRKRIHRPNFRGIFAQFFDSYSTASARALSTSEPVRHGKGSGSPGVSAHQPALQRKGSFHDLVGQPVFPVNSAMVMPSRNTSGTA
jgi:hypothetical protein